MAYKKSGGSGSSRNSGSKRTFSSAQAHQKVGETKFGYKKTYSKSSGFKMKKAK